MNVITKRFKTDVLAKEITQIENWWEKLSKENQKELRALYDDEDKAEEEVISIYLCGQFVEQERKHTGDVFWINHFYDFIINHELFEDFNAPIHIGGGICSATDVAEKSIRNGLFEVNYQCPLNKKSCIVEKILQREKGKSYELYLIFKRSKKTQ